MYKQIKTETSWSLPSDAKSMLQAIKCILYSVYDKSRVDEAIISNILLQDSLGFSTMLIYSSYQISYYLPLEKFEKILFSLFHS